MRRILSWQRKIFELEMSPCVEQEPETIDEFIEADIC